MSTRLFKFLYFIPSSLNVEVNINISEVVYGDFCRKRVPSPASLSTSKVDQRSRATGVLYEGKPRTKSSTRHCGISFCRFVVSNPRFQVSLCRFRLSLRLFVPLSGLWFVVVSFRLFSVPFRHVIIVSSFRRFVFAYEPS